MRGLHYIMKCLLSTTTNALSFQVHKSCTQIGSAPILLFAIDLYFVTHLHCDLSPHARATTSCS